MADLSYYPQSGKGLFPMEFRPLFVGPIPNWTNSSKKIRWSFISHSRLGNKENKPSESGMIGLSVPAQVFISRLLILKILA